MKKLSLSIIALIVLSITASAQTAPNTNVPIVNKMTATWCGPCGDWGWTLFEDIITDNKAKAIIMGTYGSSSSDMYNAVADAMKADFCPSAGWPAFCVNGINNTAYASGGGIYPSTTQSNCKSSCDSFAALAPAASTGYMVTKSGAVTTIKTQTKFWNAASGDYYVGVYFIEDKVLNTQNGQTGIVEHHYVLRGSATTSWGNSILNGAATVGQTFNKDFTYTIPSTWVAANLQIVTILWKKVGSDYQFINANNAANFPASITSIADAKNIAVYPNPSNTETNIHINLEDHANVSYTISDLQGRTIVNQVPQYRRFGSHILPINTANWANGNYMLHLTVDAKQYATQIVVAH
jgi:Outer membrane protein Omp28/Secretion system C-terminal sorting domain